MRRALGFTAARDPGGPRARAAYDSPMPRIWIATMAILVACLLASMVIAIVKLS